MAPQAGSTATTPATPTTPATASASVDVDFHILDQNGIKHTGSLSFSDKASGATHTDAVNNLRNLISSKINKIENSLPPEISDIFKEITIQKMPGFGIQILLPPIVVPPIVVLIGGGDDVEPIIIIPNPILIPINVSNISINWH
jgi:hypothetical protein